jgi:hypothetical protein
MDLCLTTLKIDLGDTVACSLQAAANSILDKLSEEAVASSLRAPLRQQTLSLLSVAAPLSPHVQDVDGIRRRLRGHDAMPSFIPMLEMEWLNALSSASVDLSLD